jgi:hypothetical protein
MDDSLSTKIRFEEAFHNYLECLKILPHKKTECERIIKTYHYISELKNKDNLSIDIISEKTQINNSIKKY